MAEATPVTDTAILQGLPLQSTTTDLFLEAQEGNRILISQKTNSSVFSSEVNMAEEGFRNEGSSHQMVSQLQLTGSSAANKWQGFLW